MVGVLALGVALEGTGGARLLSNGLMLGLGRFGPVALLSAVYLVTTLLTTRCPIKPPQSCWPRSKSLPASLCLSPFGLVRVRPDG